MVVVRIYLGVVVEIRVVLVVVVVMVGYWLFAIKLRPSFCLVNGFGADPMVISDSLGILLALLLVGQGPTRRRNV